MVAIASARSASLLTFSPDVAVMEFSNDVDTPEDEKKLEQELQYPKEFIGKVWCEKNHSRRVS